jgi:hypothetical protein
MILIWHWVPFMLAWIGLLYLTTENPLKIVIKGKKTQ